LIKPPRIAELILELFLRQEEAKHRLCDFEEEFQYIQEKEGVKKQNCGIGARFFNRFPILFIIQFIGV